MGYAVTEHRSCFVIDLSAYECITDRPLSRIYGTLQSLIFGLYAYLRDN
ncbi:MAG: hypothetical protein KKD53_00665 [Proteobacteria bacterium]|nr:hypothetical protein [Pseudomonadota bacterium]